ncbi:unnamed protein product [Didymodactylos carnosus]|uniref:Uncharacterized protein n=1 Tax=Didymodactylos carnosus TaxID=1234261 RepID=A0A8S2EA59_9BILA|nr:unnamed protein product [Didymodactylos carnosus]CAF3854879.1 unnamed protein product [Didymodactylos carnosus]
MSGTGPEIFVYLIRTLTDQNIGPTQPELCSKHVYNLTKDPNAFVQQVVNDIEIFQFFTKASVYSQFNEQYQIELKKMNKYNDDYNMLFHIDTIKWFEHHLKRNRNKAIRLAGEYISKIQNLNTSEFNLSAVKVKTKSLWCRNEMKYGYCSERLRCGYQHRKLWCFDEYTSGECKVNISCIPEHFNNFMHTLKGQERYDKTYPRTYQCHAFVNKEGQHCAFHVDQSKWIYADQINKLLYIVGARSNQTPVATLNPVEHCTNEDFSTNPQAWYAIVQFVEYMKTKLRMTISPFMASCF